MVLSHSQLLLLYIENQEDYKVSNNTKQFWTCIYSIQFAKLAAKREPNS